MQLIIDFEEQTMLGQEIIAMTIPLEWKLLNKERQKQVLAKLEEAMGDEESCKQDETEKSE